MSRPRQLPRLLAAFLLLCLGGGAHAAALWTDIAPAAIAPALDRPVAPEQFRALRLDLEAMRAQLAAVPHEDRALPAQAAVIELPLPDGGSERFAILETALLHPDLGAQYPEIRTYTGRGLDDPSATVRLDLTPHGFHGLILSARGGICIDPYQRGDLRHYQSYYTRANLSPETLGGCTVVDEDGMGEEIRRLIALGGGDRSGTQLRTYRAAVAATGEYTTYHGGTVALGLAAVTTSVNRVTGVYEREVAVRMQLIANNNLIIYTNGASDPYTNNNGSTMLGQNQTNLDAVIGNANYDIGHVFSTGGGGIAGLGVVCRTGQKARGVTGLPTPIGDNFDIDYVAHEMGHQYGANHTFNGTAGSCSGNRNASTAYEPGSGSTIMAYAGICSSHNLQAHSDDYFHWISIQEIVSYTTSGSGNTCPVTTATGVIEPVVDAGTGGFSIPISTPFSLTATATTTGTATYCWEESDLGPAGAPNAPSGNAPIFRSFDPVSDPTRIFPKLSNLLNNTSQIGEILPSYARTLSFKCTVRDTQAGGVGVLNDGISFSVASSGPFLVTAPNTAVTWTGGSFETVTWNVAGTDAAPVSCSAVNIRLSVDGGFTWPYLLASATPNDGSESVNVPNTSTTTARIKVEAAGNIFFDLSNFNFTIQSATGVAGDVPFGARPQLAANRPNPFGGETTLSFVLPRAARAELSVFDLSGRRLRTLVQGEVGAGDHRVAWDGTDAEGRRLSAGVYLYRLEALGESLTGRMTLLR
ncbi:hypothetical protein FJ250_06410 [bacterium]|nr:hypothetical protein [bacterium]